MGVNKIVRTLKNNEEDFEFYPTTQEIVDAIAAEIEGDVLDIGCGDGSFFRKLDDAVARDEKRKKYYGKKYGIEKSATLSSRLPEDVFLIGTDFHEQNLIDKKMNFIWCNPPYSEYEDWAVKIILTGNANKIGLVVPERWKNSVRIKEAIFKRNMESEVLGEFDFLDAERKARGKVNLVLVKGKHARTNWGDYTSDARDAFDVWFEDTFKINADKEKHYEWTYSERKSKDIKKELVGGENVAERLVELYNRDMENLLGNYKAIEKIDGDIFYELKIDLNSVKEALKVKLKGLKALYWQELFGKYGRLTDRLTSDSVQKITETLNGNNQIDFTLGNIFQITMWVIKNANKLYDEQIRMFFYDLAKPENIRRYKSNRHWDDDSWRYAQEKYNSVRWCSDEDEAKKNFKHVVLEYRVIDTGWANFEKDWQGRHTSKLNEGALTFLHDMCKIGKSLGMNVQEQKLPVDKYRSEECGINWSDFDIYLGNGEVFANVKLYKNGSKHIKFNLEFIKRLNVEVGRLLGWLRDKSDAVEEMGLTEEEAARFWNCNAQIHLEDGTKLLGLPNGAGEGSVL